MVPDDAVNLLAIVTSVGGPETDTVVEPIILRLLLLLLNLVELGLCTSHVFLHAGNTVKIFPGLFQLDASLAQLVPPLVLFHQSIKIYNKLHAEY